MVVIFFPAADLSGSDAAANRLAVQVDGAGAAQPHAAAKLRAGEVQFIAQVPQEGHIAVPVEFTGLPVYK